VADDGEEVGVAHFVERVAFGEGARFHRKIAQVRYALGRRLRILTANAVPRVELRFDGLLVAQRDLFMGVYYHLADPFYAFSQVRHCSMDDLQVPDTFESGAPVWGDEAEARVGEGALSWLEKERPTAVRRLHPGQLVPGAQEAVVPSVASFKDDRLPERGSRRAQRASRNEGIDLNLSFQGIPI
jgi:hypothetical protein